MAVHTQPQAFPSSKPLETQSSPHIKVFFLSQHLHFTPTLYFRCTLKLTVRISGIKFIFLLTSYRHPTDLIYILLYMQHTAQGLDGACQNFPWPTTLHWRRKLRNFPDCGQAWSGWESQNLCGTWPVTIRHRFLGTARLVVHGERWGKHICEVLSSSSGTSGEERR